MNSGKIQQRRRRFIGVVIPLIVIAIPCVLTYRAVRQAQLDRDMIWAAECNEASRVRSLLRQGADPNARMYIDDHRPIWRLIWDALRHSTPQSEVTDSPLCEAYSWPNWSRPDANLNTVQALLDGGTDVHVCDHLGRTPLMYAAQKGDTGVVKLLLTRHEPVNSVDQNGSTALLIACAYPKRTQIIELLLSHGANVNAADERGTTALMYAAFDLQADVVEYLLSHGANVNVRDRRGVTALFYTLQIYYGDISHYPRRTLSDSYIFDSRKTIQVLLRHGVPVADRDVDGTTALQQAHEAHDSWLDRVLRQAGAHE